MAEHWLALWTFLSSQRKNLMQKLLILQSFHRYVPTGEFRMVRKPGGEQERVEIERKEGLTKGTTVEVGDDLAADWIAKGLARAVEAANAGDVGTGVGQ